MSFFNALNISASGLTAQRLKMDIISENIANASTSRTSNGTPYKRKEVVFEENKNQMAFSSIFDNVVSEGSNGFGGIKAVKIVQDNSEGNKVYDPSSPLADEDGYVENSNVNIITEMVNMISSSRSYEANVTSMNITKSMINKTLEISR